MTVLKVMKNNLNLFRADRNTSDAYKISRVVYLNIEKFLNTKNSNEFINLFKRYFKIPDTNIRRKFGTLLINCYDFKKGKFNKQIKIRSIFKDILLLLVYLFRCAIFARKNKKKNYYGIILYGIEDNKAVFRFSRLLSKFKKPLVVANKNFKTPNKKIKIEALSKLGSVSRNFFNNNFLTILILAIKTFNLSIKSRVNYIYFFNLIVLSIIKNQEFFERNRSKILMDERFYITCPIRNFYFKKFGGLTTSAPQKSICETCISFYIDTDIFFSLGIEKFSQIRALEFGGKIKKFIPAGSLFMEHDWYRTKRDFKNVPNTDIIVLGINTGRWFKINKINQKNYQYTYTNWIKKISLKYPKLNILIKHHESRWNNKFKKENDKEINFFKNTNVKVIFKTQSRNMSYSYLYKSKVAVSFGSTMILESLTLDKPSFYLDPNNNATNFYKGLNNLKNIKISRYSDFEKKMESIIFKKNKIKIKNVSSYCLKSDKVSDRIFKHLKKFNQKKK
jgi:hypothetical protein